MFEADTRILAGVSGGADSTCLLLGLHRLGYNVSVAHLNHGWRGTESDEDEIFVRELCTKLGVPIFTRRAVSLAGQGNREAAARQGRREFFAEIVETYGFDRVALAHNRDDRVETFLLNLLRGSGSEGLSSMEPVSGMVVRPLIEIPRPDIESYLLKMGQTWRLDSTNLDSRFARNRLRLEVIPWLTTTFNSNLGEAIARTSEILSDEDQLLQSLTEDWLARNARQSEGSWSVDAGVLSCETAALQRRIIRELLKRVGEDQKPREARRGGSDMQLCDVTFDHIENARRLLQPNQSGKVAEFPGGLAISRSFERFVIENARQRVVEFDYELQIPGEIHIPELSRRFRAMVVTEIGEASANRVVADGTNLGRYVRIRNWKPGDYYRPVGLPAGKLKKLFQRVRIPRNQRHQWPVFVADSSIIWVTSFPISREFAPRGSSQRIVAFEASPN
jgi:tRNA(Ile)-lysidine synthase